MGKGSVMFLQIIAFFQIKIFAPRTSGASDEQGRNKKLHVLKKKKKNQAESQKMGILIIWTLERKIIYNTVRLW